MGGVLVSQTIEGTADPRLTDYLECGTPHPGQNVDLDEFENINQYELRPDRNWNEKSVSPPAAGTCA